MNGNTLKIIACICMLIDHTGLILCDDNTIMRAVGRLAFPIFAYFIIEGYIHTSDVHRYLMRLLLFACISEVPFDLAIYGEPFYLGAQNIFFTLTLGLTVCIIADRSIQAEQDIKRGIVARDGIGFFESREGMLITVVVIAILAELLRFDYGLAGVGTVACMLQLVLPRKYNIHVGIRNYLLSAILLTTLYICCFGLLQSLGVLALIPLAFYNGKRGELRLKYFFYCFYPLHLLALALICVVHG